MSTKTVLWPVVTDHSGASCFNCGGDLDGHHWSDSGNAPGRGQFAQYCSKCGERTYYDLKKVKRG